MRRQEIQRLVESTKDAAFAVDGKGIVIAWNAACEELFGAPAQRAVGRPCGAILEGTDECGPVCRSDCSVLAAAGQRHPIGNFDLLVETRQGRHWCNASVLLVEESGSGAPISIHILRDIDLRKRLELLMRDFIVSTTSMSAADISRLVASTRASARAVELTKQESAVMGLLAKGTTTGAIASQLHISRATVGNHIQHAMGKLGANTRLEAIRRAERAGLL